MPAALPLAHAIALGLLHGPAELLPVSSSAHVTLVPWLLDWPYPALAPDHRKAFEVALHAGTAAGIVLGEQLVDRAPARHDVAQLALTTAPVALAGAFLARPIERRLGTPLTIAAGLCAGSVALVAADRAPRTRDASAAGTSDALAIGLAQASALMPGISRAGATLAVARGRRFTRPAAARLSRRAALPVLAGVSAANAIRLWRDGLPTELRAPFAAGAVASLTSTLVVLPLARGALDECPLWPAAAYRLALAAATVRRVRQNRHP